MLRILRKKGVMKKLLWVVAILIILSLGILGTAGYLSDGGMTQSAGKIFGKSISAKDYQKAYTDVRDQALMIHGENFNQMSQYLDLEAEAWDRLMLLHEAKRQGMKVDDKEVIEYLQPSPMFHREGKFDKYLYEEIVKYIFKRPTRDFEEGIRDQLRINKLISSVTQDISIADEAVRDEYKKANERIKVNYVLFATDDYLASSTASDDELKTYFTSNPKEFEVPPSVNIEYITFPFHEDMMDAQKSALGDTIKNIVYPELDSGDKKLKDVAAKSNLTIEETGFFSIDQPVLDLGWSFETFNDIFKASKGDFIEPVETEKGMQILRIKEQRDAYTPKFDEAKPRVLEAVLRNQALMTTETKAKELIQELKQQEQTTLSAFASGKDLQIKETPFFTLGEYLPTIGISNDFQEAALSLNKDNTLSDPVKTAKGYAVIEFQDIEKMDEEKYAEEKENFKQRWLNQQRLEAVNEFMTDLRDKANLKIIRN